MRNVLALAVTLLTAVPVMAQAPLEVGSVESIDIRSESLGASGAIATRNGWELDIWHPGATYIALHFSEFDLPEGEDVTISDGAGGQSYTLSGRGKMGAGAFWARHIKGDRVLLEFYTRRGVADGFTIDRYAVGHVDLSGPSGMADPDSKAICGSDDKRNAVCYESSHPTKYNRSRAVARLLIQGTKLCTGWLASADNHLIAANHCIGDSSDALNTDYEFMAETTGCLHSSCMLCDPGTVFSGAGYIQGNAELDYTLVQVDGNPAATYGWLEIDNRAPATGERIYIPQHPGGRAKELAVESSDPDDPGWCEVDGFTAPCTSPDINYLDVNYQCDTEGGSSGSPVMAQSSHKVIALHHCANCPNRGVPIDLICDEVCPIIDPPPCMLAEDDLVLENDTVLDPETHEACETITARNNYAVAGSGELTVRARDQIVLGDGTSIQPGGELRVDIDPTTGSE